MYSLHTHFAFLLHISVSHSPHQGELMCPLHITSYCYEAINYAIDGSNGNYKRYGYNCAYIGVTIYIYTYIYIYI